MGHYVGIKLHSGSRDIEFYVDFPYVRLCEASGSKDEVDRLPTAAVDKTSL